MENLFNEINEWFGLTEFNKVMERLENGTSPTSFTGDRGPTLRDDSFGRISIKDFFNGNNGSGIFNGEMLTIEELKEEYGEENGYYWTEKNHDNTYNYSGALERDLDFKTFENDMDDTLLVFFSVHVGLDARAGYTKAFPVKYDSEYDFQEDMCGWYDLGGASFTIDGVEHTISVDGSPTSDWYRVYISDNENNEMGNYSEETSDLDMYDRNDFKESLIEYFKENEINADMDSIKIDEF